MPLHPLRANTVALLAVLALSLAVGLLMTLLIARYSDQKALRVQKDRIKAHMLAVRLYRDQPSVVSRAYGRVLLHTGHYLRLLGKPLLLSLIPLLVVVAIADRYLAYAAILPGEEFLLTAGVRSAEVLKQMDLHVPPGLRITAPPVRVPAERQMIWRMQAQQAGTFLVQVEEDGRVLGKRISVSSGLVPLSPVRLQDNFWKRLWVSNEPALAGTSGVQFLQVSYPSRSIRFAGVAWDWIWLFALWSTIAGFFFKTILRVEI